MSNSIYKSTAAKNTIMQLYDERLAGCHINYEEVYVDTSAGKTHVIITGDKSLPPIVVLHGINAGAPMALEAMKGLANRYRIYAIDTVGQATKSAETRLAMNDKTYGKWLAETMNGLGLEKSTVIGISYGGFLLHKLMAYAPEKITKGIFVVPGGFVNGPFGESMKKLSIPLIKFLFTKKENHLLKFMDAFYNTKPANDVAFQRNVLLGVKVDYRRPILLTKEDVAAMKSPVYAMVADNDIFFPGDKTLERCKVIFNDFKDAYILKNCKHIPDASRFQEIETQIEKWLKE